MAKTKRAPESVDSTELLSVRKSPRKRSLGKDEDSSKTEPPKRGRPPKSRDSSAKSTTLALKALTPADTPDLSVESSLLRTPARLQVSENDILKARTPQQLAEYLNSLVSTQQDALFEQYRQTAQLQQSADAKLIADLRSRLEKKDSTIDSLVQQLQRANQQPQPSAAAATTPKKPPVSDMYESPIRKSSSAAMIHRDDLASELKTISFTFDMLELLTGVRIVNYEDDKDKFYFDVKQTSAMGDADVDPVSIEYRLVIKRKFDQTAEVTYIPAFLVNLKKKARDAEQEVKNGDAAKVAKHLPDYLQDNLKFPYNTLSQFYTKLGKALNKAAKS